MGSLSTDERAEQKESRSGAKKKNRNKNEAATAYRAISDLSVTDNLEELIQWEEGCFNPGTPAQQHGNNRGDDDDDTHTKHKAKLGFFDLWGEN